MIGLLLLIAYAFFLFSIIYKLLYFFSATGTAYTIITHVIIIFVAMICMFLFTSTVAKEQLLKILFHIQPVSTDPNIVNVKDKNIITINDVQYEIILGETGDENKPPAPSLFDELGCYFIDYPCNPVYVETFLWLLSTSIVVFILIFVVGAYKFGKIPIKISE